MQLHDLGSSVQNSLTSPTLFCNKIPKTHSLPYELFLFPEPKLKPDITGVIYSPLTHQGKGISGQREH